MKQEINSKIYKKLSESNALDFLSKNSIMAWLNRLPAKEKDNLISIMDLDIKKLGKYKNILVKKAFLGSKHFKESIEIICNESNPEKKEVLVEILTNENFINSNHFDVFGFVLNCNDERLMYFERIFTDINALNNPKFNYAVSVVNSLPGSYMKTIVELICSTTSKRVFNDYCDVINEIKFSEEMLNIISVLFSDHNFVNSKYGIRIIKLLSETSVLRAGYIVNIITSKNLKTEILFNYILTIINVNMDEKASIIYSLIMDEELYNSRYFNEEFNYVINAKSRKILECLVYLIFDPFSKENPLYLENLKAVANSKSDSEAVILTSCFKEENERFKDISEWDNAVIVKELKF